MRWLLGNFSDPEFNLSRKEQHAVTKLAHRKHLAKRILVIWTVGISIGGWALMWFAFEPLAGLLAILGVRQVWLLSSVIICVVVGVIAAWLYRFIYVKPVRLAMRELGYDVCVACGYRLQGLTDDINRCPECGQPRERLPKKVDERSIDDFGLTIDDSSPDESSN